MLLFHKNKKPGYTALIVDVGSGSVGLALIFSPAGETAPEVLWSYREYSLIKDADTTMRTLREINTTIVNAFLKFGSDGFKALREHPDAGLITEIQVAISAPWSYTVTKTVHYTEETPFTLSETLVEELANAASKKALTAVIQQTLLSSSGLITIDNQTVGVLANDYALDSYDGIKTKDVTLFHLTAVSVARLIATLEEVHTKVIPRASLTTHSFMYIFYHVLKHLTPDTTECCLIDITNEATEIGIVRDNLLRHTSHVSYGAFTIAREIAAVTGLPKEEAYAFLRGGSTFVLSKLSTKQQIELEAIISAYQMKIAELFKETGDTLAIPKAIYLHRDADSEPFFLEQIAAAATKATGMIHTIQPITAELIGSKKHSNDTAILLSTAYFHQEAHKPHDESTDMALSV